MKRISLFLFLLLFSTYIRAQDRTPFEKYVLKNSGIIYDQKTKKLKLPTEDSPYNHCFKEDVKNKYFCNGDHKSDIFFDDVKEGGTFKTSSRISRETRITSSFVSQGKVLSHSNCYFRSAYDARKSRYLVSVFECYVATDNVCNIVARLKTSEQRNNPVLFKKFINILKSEEYKRQQYDMYKYTYRNLLISMNSDLKPSDGIYGSRKQKSNTSTHVLELEKDPIFEQYRTFQDFYNGSKKTFSESFLKPCRQLVMNNLMHGSDVEYVDTLEEADNTKTVNQ